MVLVRIMAATCADFGTIGLTTCSVGFWTMSGWLFTVAVTICKMVESIALNWAVSTKVESLKRDEVGRSAAVSIESVGNVLWVTGARKIHNATLKITSIRYGVDSG